jgi:hypothetical protein
MIIVNMQPNARRGGAILIQFLMVYDHRVRIQKDNGPSLVCDHRVRIAIYPTLVEGQEL